jgi:hypothetical protein
MRPAIRTTLIASACFVAGLGVGALGLSDELDPSPEPSAPIGAEPAGALADAPGLAIMNASPVSGPSSDEAGRAVDVTVEADAPSDDDREFMLARIEELSQGWGRMQAQLAALQNRVATLERLPLQANQVSATGAGGEPTDAARPRTPQEQRDALVRAGVDAATAESILWRRSEAELGRLELRDQALREGWLGSDRYRDELRKLNDDRVSLRDEIGADAYDRYLYGTGENNRVRVDSVIAGSAGDQNGLLPGDVIEYYGDRPIFDFRDLRDATSAGSREELVPVQVRRGNQIVEVWLPRGVLGLNAPMFEDYLHFIANRRCAQIGLPEQYPGATNPFPWMSEVLDLKKEKNFFETRVTEYQTGGALSWD